MKHLSEKRLEGVRVVSTSSEPLSYTQIENKLFEARSEIEQNFWLDQISEIFIIDDVALEELNNFTGGVRDDR